MHYSAFCGANKLAGGDLKTACTAAAACLETRPVGSVVIRREADRLEVAAVTALERIQDGWPADKIWREYGQPECIR
jgi:surface antigen